MHHWAMYGGVGVQMGILVFISHLDVTTAAVFSSYIYRYLLMVIYNPFHFNISTETVFNLMPSYLRPRCTMIGAGRLMRGSKSEKHGNHG